MDNTRITARVESVDNLNGLKIRILDTDEQAYVPADEISRRDIRNPQYLLGDLICVVPLEHICDGLPMYSARVVEEAEYEKIRLAFEEGKRNTYTATLKYVDKSGKLALYKLAYGVVGAINVKNFCLNRLGNYISFPPPQTLPVTILGIDGDKIDLSSVASFGTFSANIETLGIEPGHHVNGFATGWLPNNSGVLVMLAPNLSTVVKWAPIGKKVRVRITGIDYELNRVKAVFVEECNSDDADWLDFSRFVKYPEEAVVDSHAFVEANKVQKATKPIPPIPQTEFTDNELAEEMVMPPSFDIKSTISPLRILEDETIILDSSLPHAALGKGTSTGRLTKKHADLAEAVDTLRFTTAYHLERYLYLTNQPTYSRKTIDKMLETLCVFHVLCRFRYSSDVVDDDKKSMYVYARGTNYKPFVGKFRSFAYRVPMDGEISSYSKGRLAVNQLLLGILKNYTDVQIQGPYKFAPSETDDSNLFCCYRLYTPELGSCVIESCRDDYDEALATKLLRYNTRFQENHEDCSVLITLEDEAHVERFAERIGELHLNYRVCLTHDLKCFEKEFTKVLLPEDVTKEKDDNGKKASFWDKLKGLEFLNGISD